MDRSPGFGPAAVSRLGTAELRAANPVEQVLNYRSEIANLYSVETDGKPGLAAVALVFPFAPRGDAVSALAPALEHRRSTSIPIMGREDLDDATFDLARVAVRSRRSPESVARLREWLVGPVEIITSEPVPLTSRQRELITTRTDSGFRRIRVPAGSGKSLVLAGRAARLSREGKDVLVVSFNHTLSSYLRRTATSFGVDSRRITWLGFHEWCKRVMVDTGRWPEYQQLWKADTSSAVLELELPRAVASALAVDSDELTPRYDAILVDEGQDFLPDWWDCLRHASRPRGEMVLAADLAQDVFGHGRSWTETSMRGAGFTGKWADFLGQVTAYRCP